MTSPSEGKSLGVTVKSGKPVVALALSRATHDIMFTSQDLVRLTDAANVLGPFENAPAASQLKLRDVSDPQQFLAEATVAITGWGSPRFDEALLAFAPN